MQPLAHRQDSFTIGKAILTVVANAEYWYWIACKYKEQSSRINYQVSHHGDVEPESDCSLVAAADACSPSRSSYESLES